MKNGLINGTNLWIQGVPSESGRRRALRNKKGVKYYRRSEKARSGRLLRRGTASHDVRGRRAGAIRTGSKFVSVGVPARVG